MPDFHTICQANEIPEGEARMFVVNDVMVGVFHIDGQFHALDNPLPGWCFIPSPEGGAYSSLLDNADTATVGTDHCNRAWLP